MNQARYERLPWEAGFSASVSNARARINITVEELARLIREYGVLAHAHTVQEIESGARPINLAEALVICKILDLELPDIWLPVRVQLINQSFAQDIALAEKKWVNMLNRLAEIRREVMKLLQDAGDLRLAYVDSVDRAGAPAEPKLLASADALTEQISSAHDLLGGILLSKPVEASPSGSQRN